MKPLSTIMLVFGIVFANQEPIQAQNITTVAGTGQRGFSGDGGPAMEAKFDTPGHLVVDSTGNIYVVDEHNFRIRKIDTSGTITTIAGTGERGSGGDGGPAIEAQLNFPSGIALDKDGNLYIAEGATMVDGRIRKISPSGIITTIWGMTPDGRSKPDTCPFICTIWPYEVAVDTDGTVYVLQLMGGLSKMAPTGEITTVPVVFAGPAGGIALDGSGNLYVASSLLNTVVKVTPQGEQSTVAGTGEAGFSGDGGPATQAKLSGSIGVVVDSAGNLYFSDEGNGRIRKVSPDGSIVTVAGVGDGGDRDHDNIPATDAHVCCPASLAVDPSGNLYFSDYLSRIRKVTFNSPPQTTPTAQIKGGTGSCASFAPSVSSAASSASFGSEFGGTLPVTGHP